MAIDPRLRQLFDELIADKGYVSGRRSFPRTLTEDDAVHIVGYIHEEMDRAAAARAAAARRMGKPLACGTGCTGCCEEPVQVFRPEAVRIARWLRRSENAATRQAFLDGYAAWKSRVGDGPERLAELFRTGDEPGHVAEYIAQWKRRIPCAFLRDGLCTIYDVRPLVCRNAHAVGTADRCYGDSADATPPVRVAADDVDNFVETSRGRIRAAHHALGGPRATPAGLCDAVYALLTPAEPARP